MLRRREKRFEKRSIVRLLRGTDVFSDGDTCKNIIINVVCFESAGIDFAMVYQPLYRHVFGGKSSLLPVVL